MHSRTHQLPNQGCTNYLVKSASDAERFPPFFGLATGLLLFLTSGCYASRYRFFPKVGNPPWTTGLGFFPCRESILRRVFLSSFVSRSSFIASAVRRANCRSEILPASHISVRSTTFAANFRSLFTVVFSACPVSRRDGRGDCTRLMPNPLSGFGASLV